jgi:hypothetical protein
MTPTYSVQASDPRYRALFVGFGHWPTADVSALLGQWHRDGYRYFTPTLAQHLGATAAVVRDPSVAEGIILGLEADEE